MNLFQKIAYNFRQQGVLAQIIIVNAAIFLTVNLVGNLSRLDLLDYLALPVNGEVFLYRFWTLFTYMFTHAGLGHIFWNMFLFYTFAQIFFILFGQRKLLYVYTMGGLAGSALLLLLGILFPDSFGHSYLIGASAAVMGVGALMAIYTPYYRVNLYGIFEMPYLYFFILVFVLNTVIDLAINTGGKIAHLGGTAFGLLYGYYLKKGSDLFDFGFSRAKKSKLKVVSRNDSPAQSRATKSDSDEQTMNELLDKISRSGYESLTKSEKEELFRLSQKK